MKSVTFALFIVIILHNSALGSITMDYVTIGDPNNTGYGVSPPIGSIDYVFKMGKYEVTTAQYAEFLNAKAKTDPYGLYHSSMGTRGLSRSGVDGAYNYTVSIEWQNKPISLVSFFDAARFANWLGNGQGSSDMEDGAYTLLGATSGAFNRNSDSVVWIPSYNEWTKAAYYNANSAAYSLFPNGKNQRIGSEMNYSGSIVDVGSYPQTNYYGTHDQGGNMAEWTDTDRNGGINSDKIFRGGSYSDHLNNESGSLMRIDKLSDFSPQTESWGIGFRVASIPEPSISLLIGMGLVVMTQRRLRY